jgi:hypothetical protein
MKNYKLIIILSLLAALVSCDKKYDDGPCISFVAEQKRIIGKWEIEKLIVNQEVLTDKYNSKGFNAYNYTFSRNVENEKFLILDNISNSHGVAQSRYYLNDENTERTFYLKSFQQYYDEVTPLFNFVPAFNDECKWTISRLKTKEMWINTTYQDVYYEVHFKLVYDIDIN